MTGPLDIRSGSMSGGLLSLITGPIHLSEHGAPTDQPHTIANDRLVEAMVRRLGYTLGDTAPLETSGSRTCLDYVLGMIRTPLRAAS